MPVMVIPFAQKDVAARFSREPPSWEENSVQQIAEQSRYYPTDGLQSTLFGLLGSSQPGPYALPVPTLLFGFTKPDTYRTIRIVQFTIGVSVWSAALACRVQAVPLHVTCHARASAVQ
jgi:hypothetical protein